jgi:uncharacterized protein (DUF433 family)
MSDGIEINPNFCHGKPVIAGTRVSVAIVVGSLASGMSFEEVCREYSVGESQIRAALRFACDLVGQIRVRLIPEN